MSHIFNFIQIHHTNPAIYLLIFLAMVFDAALTVFAAIFLAVSGALLIIPTIIVLFLGTLGEQMLWYWVGKHLGRWKKLMSLLDGPAKPFDKHLINRPAHTLTLSKFIYGIHRAMLVRAGMLHIEFRRYAKIAAVSSSLWLLVLGLFAVGFSASYQVLKEYISYAELIPLGFVVIYFIVDIVISRKLKKNL